MGDPIGTGATAAQRTMRAALLVVAAGLGAWLLSACDPPPLDLVVTSTTDAVDAAPGDGVCETATPDECTLRAAIQEANAQPDPVNVHLADGETYPLTRVGADEDAAATGDLDVTGRLEIRGEGATVDASGLDRVLHVRPGADVGVFGVELTGGSARTGGGVLVDAGATADLLATTITGNEATGNYWCISSRLYLGCDISSILANPPHPDDNSPAGGGGVRNDGTLVLEGSTLSANETNGPTGCGGVLTSSDCRFHEGGGLFNTGTATVSNSTISGNEAVGGNGGGIADVGTATIDHSTVVDNEAADMFRAELDQPARPGATALAFGPATTIRASVVAGPGQLCNRASGPDPIHDPVLNPLLTSSGHNVADDDSCNLTAPTDQADTDPLLGPLAANGGPTLTHLPQVGSPVLDLVAPVPVPGCGSGLVWDQRGLARAAGGGCDAGAVEREP